MVKIRRGAFYEYSLKYDIPIETFESLATAVRRVDIKIYGYTYRLGNLDEDIDPLDPDEEHNTTSKNKEPDIALENKEPDYATELMVRDIYVYRDPSDF
ncbi:MAG: hypothetical protein QXU18_15455 [Thermoplasmatales archaeon]